MPRQAISSGLFLVLLLAAQAGFASNRVADVFVPLGHSEDHESISDSLGVYGGYGPIFDPSGVPAGAPRMEPPSVTLGIGPIFDPSGVR